MRGEVHGTAARLRVQLSPVKSGSRSEARSVFPVAQLCNFSVDARQGIRTMRRVTSEWKREAYSWNFGARALVHLHQRPGSYPAPPSSWPGCARRIFFHERRQSSEQRTGSRVTAKHFDQRAGAGVPAKHVGAQPGATESQHCQAWRDAPHALHAICIVRRMPDRQAIKNRVGGGMVRADRVGRILEGNRRRSQICFSTGPRAHGGGHRIAQAERHCVLQQASVATR